jgi:hypothetical protein
MASKRTSGKPVTSGGPAGKEIYLMLKKLMVCLVLIVSVGALSGCHAGAHGDKGHGASVDVG